MAPPVGETVSAPRPPEASPLGLMSGKKCPLALAASEPWPGSGPGLSGRRPGGGCWRAKDERRLLPRRLGLEDWAPWDGEVKAGLLKGKPAGLVSGTEA